MEPANTKPADQRGERQSLCQDGSAADGKDQLGEKGDGKLTIARDVDCFWYPSPGPFNLQLRIVNFQFSISPPAPIVSTAAKIAQVLSTAGQSLTKPSRGPLGTSASS
jgi:hypothetical protein